MWRSQATPAQGARRPAPGREHPSLSRGFVQSVVCFWEHPARANPTYSAISGCAKNKERAQNLASYCCLRLIANNLLVGYQSAPNSPGPASICPSVSMLKSSLRIAFGRFPTPSTTLVGVGGSPGSCSIASIARRSGEGPLFTRYLHLCNM